MSQKGTARFSQSFDVPALPETYVTGSDCLIGLNESREQQLIVKAEGHLLTIGSTRSGKTVGQVIPNLMYAKGSSVVIDPKGEIAWSLAKYLRETGRRVVVLDPFNEVNSHYAYKAGEEELIGCCNPMSELNPSDMNYVDKIDFIVTSLIFLEGKDPHWSQAAQELVAGLIAYLVETRSETKNLGRVKEIISSGLTSIIEIARLANEYSDTSLARKKLTRYAGLNSTHDNKEEHSIISTCLSQLKFLDNPLITDSLSSSHFNFAELAEGRHDIVVFIVLAPSKLKTYNRWLRLMISMAIEAISSAFNSPKTPVTFYLDEFGTIGTLPAIAQAVGLMAGRGVRLWFFIQTLSQLKRDYPDEWENFIGNCSAISILKAADYHTADYISKRLGEKTVHEDVGRHQSTSTYPLLTPDQIMQMSNDTGIVITDTYPTRFKKILSYKDAPFAGHIRSNPDYNQ